MVDYMSEQILKQTQTTIAKEIIFSLNAYEVITINNQSWISMHAWKRIDILFTLQCVIEGENANNLIVIIVQAFM